MTNVRFFFIRLPLATAAVAILAVGLVYVSALQAGTTPDGQLRLASLLID